MGDGRFVLLAIWGTVAFGLAAWRVNIRRNMLNNMAPGIDFWKEPRLRGLRLARRDDAIFYNPVGQANLVNAITAERCLVVWWIGGVVLLICLGLLERS